MGHASFGYLPLATQNRFIFSDLQPAVLKNQSVTMNNVSPEKIRTVSHGFLTMPLP